MKGQLISYWITFLEEPHAPMGIGVTAFSEEDAVGLIKEAGYEAYMQRDYVIKSNIKIEDLDPDNVVPRMGPMAFRGVWHPCYNIGFGASGQRRIEK